MTVPIALLEAGFAAADEVLSALGAPDAPPPPPERLDAAARAAAERISAAVGEDRGGEGIHGSAALFEVGTRVRDVAAALPSGDRAWPAVDTLRAWVDEARGWAREWNPPWIGAYLGGSAVLAAAQARLAGTRGDADALRQEADELRFRVLDEVAVRIVTAEQSMPWLVVRAFLNGERSPVLRVLFRALGEPLPASSATVRAALRMDRPGWDQEVREMAEAELRNVPGVYFAPDIPPRKLSGARRKLLKPVPEGEELIALGDTTIFGGAADGFGVCVRGFAFADISDQPEWVEYSSLLGAEITADGSAVLLRGRKLKVYDAGRARAFADFLTRLRGWLQRE